MRSLASFGAAVIAAIGVIDLVIALVVALAVAIWVGIRLFRRAVKMDESFSEILLGQDEARAILSKGHRPQPQH